MEKKINNPQIIFSWKAPLRAYKKTKTSVLRFYVSLSFLLSLIVFFFGEKTLILPIWAIMFLFYILTITPPPEIENKITKFGIETSNSIFRWDVLSHFYFIKKFDYTVLTIVSVAPYHYHIYLVLKNEEDVNILIKIISEHLVYQEHPQKTFTDKLIVWLTKLMPESDIKDKGKEASSGINPGVSLSPQKSFPI